MAKNKSATTPENGQLFDSGAEKSTTVFCAGGAPVRMYVCPLLVDKLRIFSTFNFVFVRSPARHKATAVQLFASRVGFVTQPCQNNNFTGFTLLPPRACDTKKSKKSRHTR